MHTQWDVREWSHRKEAGIERDGIWGKWHSSVLKITDSCTIGHQNRLQSVHRWDEKTGTWIEVRPNTYRDTVHSWQKWINRQPWKWTWKVRFCSDKWTKQRDINKEFVGQLDCLIFCTWVAQVCRVQALRNRVCQRVPLNAFRNIQTHGDKTETKSQFNIEVVSSAGDAVIVRANHSWLQTCLNQWRVPEWMSRNHVGEMHVWNCMIAVSPRDASGCP